MKKEAKRITGFLLVIIGIFLLLQGFSGITGGVTFEGIGKATSALLGIIILFAGILILATGEKKKNLEAYVTRNYKSFRSYLEEGNFRNLSTKKQAYYFQKLRKEMMDLPSEERESYAKRKLYELSQGDEGIQSVYDDIATKVYETLILKHAYGHHTESIADIEDWASGGRISKSEVNEVIQEEADQGRLKIVKNSVSVSMDRKKLEEIIDTYGDSMKTAARDEFEELKNGKIPSGVR